GRRIGVWRRGITRHHSRLGVLVGADSLLRRRVHAGVRARTRIALSFRAERGIWPGGAAKTIATACARPPLQVHRYARDDIRRSLLRRDRRRHRRAVDDLQVGEEARHFALIHSTAFESRRLSLAFLSSPRSSWRCACCPLRTGSRSFKRTCAAPAQSATSSTHSSTRSASSFWFPRRS